MEKPETWLKTMLYHKSWLFLLLDSKFDKKKKFKPFKKMKNFFRGGSKKQFKPEDIKGGKAHSIAALHQKNEAEEDDDDGGLVLCPWYWLSNICKWWCVASSYVKCKILHVKGKQ